MNTEELRRILKSENINSFAYSLSDEDPVALENVYCMRVHKDYVEIYGTDRADKLDVQRFPDEASACREFLKMMGTYHDERLLKYV